MRILFTCRPLFGHFQPLVPLAKAAQQRGHVVFFASGNPIAEQARTTGFDSDVVGLSDAASVAERDRCGIVFRGLSADVIRAVAFGQWFSGVETPPRLADLDRVCAQFRPDILVHEVAELAAPLAAATAGLPWVTVGFGPLLQPEAAALAGEGVAPLWHARGLTAPRHAGLYQHLYVDPCPPALQIEEAKALPARIGIRPAAAMNARARQTADRIYLTFGTVYNTGPTAAHAMSVAIAGSADVGAEVIVTVGRNNDPSVFGLQPANVQVLRFIPQDEILPSCRCVVAHGGAGTLLGALAWGVPLLLVPQGADQFYNADRATRAGVALALGPEEISREAVTNAVRRLLDEPAFAARAAEVRTELAAMPDTDMVLDRIERLAINDSR